MTDAPLTPAEAYVLLDPGEASSIVAFKITFFLLLAMEVLQVTTAQTRTLFLIRGTKPVVSAVKDPPAVFLAAEIVDTIRMARGSEQGYDFLSLAHAAHKRLFIGPSDIVIGQICPALVARGWLEATEQSGRRQRTLYSHTPAGLVAKQRIESRLDRARGLPALIDTNPVEAQAIVREAGSLVLLVPELRAILGRLAALDAGGAPDGDSLVAPLPGGGYAKSHSEASLQSAFDAAGVGFVAFEGYFDGSRYTD